MKKILFLLLFLKCFGGFCQIATPVGMNSTGQFIYSSAIGQATTAYIATASATVTNTASETSIVGTGLGSMTIPANTLTAGKVFRIKISGVYSTPAITAGSVVVKIKLGSTVIATGTASSLLVSASSASFSGMGIITCRTSGSGGTVVTDGALAYSVGNNLGNFSLDLNNAGATTTVNTTISQLLDVTVTWDSGSTSKIITSTTCIVEALN